MAVSPEYMEFLEEQLAPMGNVRSRSFFGGAGVYVDGVMIGMVMADKLYFKVDAECRERFEEAGLEPFTYQKKSGTVGVLAFFEAPESALDDQDEMLDWAREGYAAGLRAAKIKDEKAARSEARKKAKMAKNT